MSAWGAALRIARRDALRHRWRSLLIIALILVPVAGATAVDILYRTSTSTELEQERVFGGADALIEPRFFDTVTGAGVTSAEAFVPPAEDLLAALPAGTRLVPDPLTADVVLTTPGHLTRSSLYRTDHLGDPLLRARAELVSGGAPQSATQAAISRSLAEDLGLPRGDALLGAQFDGRDGGRITVSGVVRDPFCLSCSLVVTPLRSELATSDRLSYVIPDAGTRYYVDLPAGYERGERPIGDLPGDVGLQYRASYGTSQYGFSEVARSSDALTAAALVTLIAGLGLLEVVLLAGTAFAVGARRQTRDLGMLAAQGGSPRDLRRVVLAQGLLLGAIGTLGGLALGFGAMALSDPLWERLGNEVRVGLNFGTAEIVVVMVVGFGSGLAAALFPALGASRRSTTDLLAARFPAPDARSRRGPIAGALLLIAGFGLAVVASASIDRGWFGYGELTALDGTDDVFYSSGPSDTSIAVVILVGVFIAVAGLLLVTPTLLSMLARLAGRLPSTLRLATRDASRHRHRTGPATAAIAVAVGSAIAISCLIASEGEGPESRNLPAVPSNVVAFSTQGSIDDRQVEPAAAAAGALVPGSSVIPVITPVPAPVPNQVDEYFSPMTVIPPRGGLGPVLGIGDADFAVVASGRLADRAAAAAALAEGKVVVFDPALLATDGTVLLDTGYNLREQRGTELRLPAVVLAGTGEQYSLMPGALVSPQVAQAQGWATVTRTILLAYPDTSRSEAAAAVKVAENLGVTVYTGDDEDDITRLVRVGLSSAAVLIGLLGVAMCVALSAAEGRPDLATLSAVGAAPARRRRLAAMQALVLATLGTALGIAFGFFFARAARPATGAVETIIPWGDLFPIIAAVPVLAVVIGLLGSLGRIQVTRRVD
ncbi:MAG: ABC transporter permease [Sporichthyaceae bacterium]